MRTPQNRYEYNQAFAQLLKKPVGYVLGRTKDWPDEWHAELYSLIKYEREKQTKVKLLMKWLRDARIKE